MSDAKKELEEARKARNALEQQLRREADQGPPLACPRCGRSTTSLKQFTLCQLYVFLFAWFRWQDALYQACPSCMRRMILQRTVVNVFPANVVWLGVIAPFHTQQFVRTFVPGHSEDDGNGALKIYTLLFFGAFFVFAALVFFANQ